MAYEKQTWVDGVSPLNAERLNYMEDGIASKVEKPTNGNGTAGQALLTNGNGTTYWGNVSGGSGGGSGEMDSKIAYLTVTSDNLFDNVFDESGYITPNGDAESGNFKRTSRYYEIPDGDDRAIYFCTSEPVATFVVAVYDVNKKFINTYANGQIISRPDKYFRVYTRNEYAGNSYVSIIPYGDPVDYSYSEQMTITDDALYGTKLRKDVDGLRAEVNEFPYENVVTSDNLFDNNFDEEGYLSNGILAANSEWRCTSKYYKLPEYKYGGMLHIRQNVADEQLYIAIYDESGNFLDTYNTKDVSYSIPLHGKSKLFKVYRRKSCNATVYVSSVLPNANVNYEYMLKPVGVVKPLINKRIVCFGDSIFGMFRDEVGYNISIPQIIGDKTGASCFNVGFGGCRMTPHEPPYDLFSMYNLADAIVSGDWSAQENSVSTHSGLPSYFAGHLETLKQIKWENVDVITIAYGTNDYTASRPIEATDGTFENEYDYFKGALHYSIEKMLTAYPHLKIVVITPTYRWFLDDSRAYSHDCDDDAARNNLSYLLKDYVDACKEVCEKYHIQCIDNFSGIGMNKYNRLQYFESTDGTHPNRNGRQLLAYNIADQLLRLA